MRTILLLFLCSLSGLNICAQNTWVQKSFPPRVGRDYPVCVSIGDEACVATESMTPMGFWSGFTEPFKYSNACN